MVTEQDLADEVLAEEVPDSPGSWLLAGDLPRVSAALGRETSVWRRFAHGGAEAHPWPPDGPFERVALRLPRGSAAIEMILQALAGRLDPRGELFVTGRNDEGIRSAEKRLGQVFGEVETVATRRHCRVYRARAPLPGLRVSLEDWAERIDLYVGERAYPTWTWPGLFAHGRLDAGSALLADHFDDLGGKVVLDFASGAGILARAAQEKGASVELCDVDALAVHAARRNVPDRPVFLGDGLPTTGRWDVIVSNPPLHRDNAIEPSVIAAFGKVAQTRLNSGGSLRLVTPRAVPIARWLGAGWTLRRLASRDGFVVHDAVVERRTRSDQ